MTPDDVLSGLGSCKLLSRERESRSGCKSSGMHVATGNSHPFADTTLDLAFAAGFSAVPASKRIAYQTRTLNTLVLKLAAHRMVRRCSENWFDTQGTILTEDCQ